MGKTLLLLRHGKTEHRNYSNDHQRELTSRGETQARFIGEYIKSKGIHLDKIVSSSAVRAESTAEICSAAQGFSGVVEVTDGLYGINTDELLRYIAALDPALDSVLFVGHNPCFEEAVSFLARKMVGMGTGDCARFSIDSADWNVLSGRTVITFEEIIQAD